jgi:DNA invertase Pin-like site-specific DNA recombinase
LIRIADLRLFEKGIKYHNQVEVVMQVKKAAIYVRVSTADQDAGMQEQELVEYVASRNWALHKIYRDVGVSGVAEKRPGLDALLNDCRRRRLSIIVVWKFDRFARSLRQLVNALELFRELGIAFVSCTEAIDTSLPHGELLFQIMGSIAQFEKSLITERVKAGLRHARTNGKILGRPPLRRLTSKEIVQLRSERSKAKLPFRILAKKFGVSVFTAHQLCGKSRKTKP